VIQQTLAPVPAASRPVLVVEQRHHPFLSQIEEEYGYLTAEGEAIVERGNGLYFQQRGDPWPIHVSDTTYLPERDSLAIAAAHRAAGLPVLPVEMDGRPYTDEEIAQFHATPEELVAAGIEDADAGSWWPGKESGEPPPEAGDRWPLVLACDAEGQAREVLAAWLAAGASPVLADAYQGIRADGPAGPGGGDYGHAITEYQPNDGPAAAAVDWGVLGWIRGSGYGSDVAAAAVLGSPTATDLAAQLLEHADPEVAGAVAEHWDEWTDPTTGVAVIIDEFDLEPPPTPQQWLRRGGLEPAEFAAAVAAYPRWVGEVEFGEQPYPICQ